MPANLTKKLEQLKQELRAIYALNMVLYVLDWDQSTYMPAAGGEARGRQIALIAQLAHEKMTSRTVGKLLDMLQSYGESLPYDSDDAALLRVARRNFERLIKVPPAFVAELSELNTNSYVAWSQARPYNDFAAVLPLLEKKLDLSRRLADYFPGYAHVGDPLISLHDYGMSAATIRPIFAELRRWLTPLVKKICDQAPADDALLFRKYPIPAQLGFTESLVKQIGYDFSRGRQDLSPHPFMTKFSVNDVRITTRVFEDNLGSALFSSLHEAGHAMYEQGIAPRLDGLPLADGTSSGVHESQSRLWENLVGRSRGFWQHYFPQLQAVFPDQLKQVSVDQFYRAINKVERSLIRTEADEVTYNLHVIMRFELEMEMLEGKLAINDLPEAWDQAYSETLGVTAPDNRDGCMQDVHWFAGPIGGSFQGYTLGNIMSAQFYAAAERAHPEIAGQVNNGDFATLLAWLRENVYQHGSKFTAAELLQRATGSDLALEPYKAYITTKYGDLYQL